MKGTIVLQRKLQTIGASIMLTIPRQLVALKGWKKGDVIQIVEKDGDLVLKKKAML
jgi:hypothetical protein